MSLDKVTKPQFQDIMQEHINKIIIFLLDENQEFAVASDTKFIKFNPELPKEIRDQLPEITLFMLSNYTFETSSVDDEYLRFEAGFGDSNFGSYVSIPILAIRQIFIENHPIAINLAPPKPEEVKKEYEDEDDEVEIDSMSALLNNPENAKLLKKKR